MGELEVCLIPTSIESLPHVPFLDHHSSHIIRKSEEAMKNQKQMERTNQLLISMQQKPLLI